MAQAAVPLAMTVKMDVGSAVESYQLSHQATRGEVSLQKDNKVASRQKDRAAENQDGWLRPNCLIEGVETGCW